MGSKIGGLFALLLCLLSTAVSAQGNVTISGSIPQSPNNPIKIIRYKSYLEGSLVTLGKTDTDKAGHFTLRIHITSAQPVMLSFNQSDMMTVWLEPNDSLFIDIPEANKFIRKAKSSSGSKGRTIFSGTGSVINNYMFAADLTVYNPDLHMAAMRLSPYQYLAFQDSIQAARLRVRQQQFAGKFSALAEAYLHGEIIYSTFYQKSMIRAYNQDMSSEDSLTVLTPEFLAYWKRWTVPPEQTIISPMYRHCVLIYLSMKVEQELGLPTDDQAREIFASRVFHLARTEPSLQPGVRQLATAMKLYIMALVSTKRDSLYALARIYHADYPNSYYDKVLREKLAIDDSSGKPAPRIEGRDTTNRLVDVASLKGKVVYVDIWASSCGPCIAEFPNSIKLSQQFRDQVHFVYLNISDSEDKWRKTIAAKKLKGIHLRADDELTEQIISTYSINAIPRYILIDQDGKLVDAHAKRPAQVEGDIRRLLDR